MSEYKDLVKRLREEKNHEAADAIENLLMDIECRRTIARGLVYLNNELSKASAGNVEQIRQLQEEIRRLNSENFWLCRGG